MESASTSFEQQERGLLFAFRVDPKGNATAIDGDVARSPEAGAGYSWLHFVSGPQCEQWLTTESGLPPAVIESLLAEGARPRCSLIDDGLLVVLRGVNLNPGQDPEDMVAVRGWFTATRVVTVRIRPVMAIQDLRGTLTAGKGPADPGSLLGDVIDSMLDRLRPVVEEIEDALEQIEEQIAAGELERPQDELGELKTSAIRLRRHMSPQREALEKLRGHHPSWFNKGHLATIRELSQRTARLVDDLDVMLARASVAHDEIAQELAARMNRAMYRLSIIAGIFLPLSFLTGLLGINVGGMPGVDHAAAFWWVCGICAIVGGILVWVSRRKRLL